MAKFRTALAGLMAYCGHGSMMPFIQVQSPNAPLQKLPPSFPLLATAAFDPYNVYPVFFRTDLILIQTHFV